MYHLCRESHSETIMLALATSSEIREPISMMVKDFSELSTKRNVTHGSHKVCKFNIKSSSSHYKPVKPHFFIDMFVIFTQNIY